MHKSNNALPIGARKALVSFTLVALSIVFAGCGNDAGDANRAEAVAGTGGERSDPRRTLLELKEAVQLAPDSSEARYRLGEFYLRMGDGAAALDELNAAIDAGAGPVRVEPKLIRALLQKGDVEKAMNRLADVEGRDSSAELLALQADAYVQSGESEPAKLYYEEALALDSAHVPALVGSALLALRTGDLDAAKTAADRALAVAPEDATVQAAAGEVALAQGRFDEAIRYFDELARLNPFSSAGGVGKARVEMTRGQFDEALALLKEQAKKFNGDLNVTLQQGLVSYFKGADDAAKDYFGTVLSKVPTHPGAQFYLAATLFRLQQLEQAENYLKAFLNQYPSYSPAIKLLASIELREHKPKDALETLDQAVAGDSQTAVLRAKALIASGDIDAGIAEFKRAAKENPDDKVVETELNLVQIRLGDLDDLLPTLQTRALGEGDTLESIMWVAYAHLAWQQWDEVVKFVTSLPADKRENAQVYNALGMAYFGKGDVAAARDAFTHGIEIEPATHQLRRNLANLLLDSGELDEAKQEVEALEKLAPQAASTLITAARLATLRGDDEGALALLEKARSTDSNDIESRRMLAARYLKKGLNEETITVCKEGLEIRPGDSSTLVLLGEALARTGRIDAAAQALTAAIASDPSNAYALVAAGTLKMEQGDFAGAGPILERAASIVPDNPDVLAARALVDTASGQRDEASRLVDALEEMEGVSARVAELRGDLAAAAGDFEKAVAAYGMAVQKKRIPESASKLHYSQLRAGEADLAVAGLEHLRDEFPDNVDVLSNLAQAYSAVGRDVDAAQVYETVLERKPDDIVALNNLALLKSTSGDPGGLVLAERAQKLAPGNPEIADTLGWILVGRGEAERAIDLYRRTIDRVKAMPAAQQASIRYHYAVALARNRERKKAVTELRAIAGEIDTDFPEREDAQALLKSLE